MQSLILSDAPPLFLGLCIGGAKLRDHATKRNQTTVLHPGAVFAEISANFRRQPQFSRTAAAASRVASTAAAAASTAATTLER